MIIEKVQTVRIGDVVGGELDRLQARIQVAWQIAYKFRRAMFLRRLQRRFVATDGGCITLGDC